MSESARIADQLNRAFHGEAWHGPALLSILRGVRARLAAARPIRTAHSIWELVLHVMVWDAATLRRIEGQVCQPKGLDNFPRVPKPASEAAWHETLDRLKTAHAELEQAVAAMPDVRLGEIVPGKKYDFYHQLHGTVQHELYHAGQIALLKKARRRARRK